MATEREERFMGPCCTEREELRPVTITEPLPHETVLADLQYLAPELVAEFDTEHEAYRAHVRERLEEFHRSSRDYGGALRVLRQELQLTRDARPQAVAEITLGRLPTWDVRGRAAVEAEATRRMAEENERRRTGG